MSAGGDRPNPADVFTLLATQRYQLVIGYLSLFNPGADVEVRHIARVARGIETDTPPRQVSADNYESAYNGLIQTHLPKLDAGGVVEYDERRKTVTVTLSLGQYAFIHADTQLVVSGGTLGWLLTQPD